jgi:hypothetical protein
VLLRSTKVQYAVIDSTVLTSRCRNLLQGYSSAVFRASERICRRKGRLRAAHSRRTISVARSADGMTKPFAESRIRSEAPQVFVASTGVPQAKASSTTRPNPSLREGRQSKSARRYSVLQRVFLESSKEGCVTGVLSQPFMPGTWTADDAKFCIGQFQAAPCF